MANVKFYSGGGSLPLGGQIDEIPYITAKPGQINTVASTRLRFTEKMVKALMDKREADMKRDDRAQYMAAATTKGFDPSKMAPMEEESPYVGMQREDMARALRTPQPSNLGGLEEAGDVSRFFRPEGGTESLFGANPSIDPAMQAALLGDVGTRAEDEAAYLAKQKAAHIGPREAMRNLTPRTEYGKNLQSEYELGEMERDRALQEAEVERQITADLLVEANKEARLLKAIGPPKAGEKPGTPYEVNGRLVQDFIDQDGNWATRDVGAAAPQTYSSRKASALQLTDRMTELRAQIAAIPDKNSPERKVLEKELDDLLFNAARDPEALGKVAFAKSWKGAEGVAEGDGTIAERKIDEEFAKEYALGVPGGGYEDASKQVDQLESAITELGGSDDLTGPVRGMVPDFVRAFTNPKAVDVKERVQEVIQRNLRLILGAQFTEEEGKILISRAYNDQMTDSVNAARLNRLVGAMRKALAAKMSAAQYYEDNGTLRGWKGALPKKSDFTGIDFDSSQQADLPPGVRSVQVVGE
jgi:hypothetical protein